LALRKKNANNGTKISITIFVHMLNNRRPIGYVVGFSSSFVYSCKTLRFSLYVSLFIGSFESRLMASKTNYNVKIVVGRNI